MFRTVVIRSLSNKTCTVPFIKLAYSVRYQSNRAKDNWQLNNSKYQKDQDQLTREEKSIRKLKLQEELKKLQAEEDLEKEDEEGEEKQGKEEDDNQKSDNSPELNDSKKNDSKKLEHSKEIDSEDKIHEKHATGLGEKDEKPLNGSGSSQQPDIDKGLNELEIKEPDSGKERKQTEKPSELTSYIEQTVTHDFKPKDSTLSAKIQHKDLKTIRHRENHSTIEQETIEKTKISDENNLEGSMNVLATSASLIPGDKFPQIDEKINRQIHREIDDLPSQKEKRKSELSKKITSSLESFQETILKATRVLNDVTGYSAIEKLKNSIEKLENELKQSKSDVKKAKKAYNEAIHTRSKSQREVNELLTRKHDWNSNDLERFTELYRNDHTNELRENEAQKALNEAELKVDGIQLKLTQLILTRYHEEQIWSDKIRQASTWGTWMIMGANLLLFIIATFFVEPWKRRRLVNAFEQQVKETLVGISQNDRKIIDPVMEEFENNSDAIDPVIEEIKDFAGAMVSLNDSTHDDSSEVLSTVNENEASVDQIQIHEEELLENLSPIQSPHSLPLNLLQLLNNTWNKLNNTWNRLTSTIVSNYYAFVDSLIHEIQIQKSELAFITAFFTFLGGGLGSIITIYYKS